MSNRLTKEQIEDLLEYCGSTPTFWRDNDMLCCCPIHGEKNPSMGVNEEMQVFHCFACGASGDFAKLLYMSRPDDFGYDDRTEETEKKTWYKANKKARAFLKDRYELEYRELFHKGAYVKKYEDLRIPVEKEDETIPKWKIAPFQSGKATYQYFFRRGFDKEDMQKFMIGYDDDNKTVTIPVFNEENKLVGVIGRYISSKRKKNERYKIYDHFERSRYLYPENFLKVKNDTIILVEGQFDAMYMHKIGYENTLALMTDSISRKQIEFLESHCSKIIYIGDNDNRGRESRQKTYEKLKGKFDFFIVDFPREGKDVCDWSKEEIDNMVKNCHSMMSRKIRRK